MKLKPPIIELRVQSVHPGTRVIAVANQKGGVSRTTTSPLKLAEGLAMSGQRVLLVDLDSQGGCAVSLVIAIDSHNRTVYNVLTALVPKGVRTQEIGFLSVRRANWF